MKSSIECLAIVGSRSLDPRRHTKNAITVKNKKRAFKLLDKIHAKTPIKSIVSGGALGPDSWAEEWAAANKVPVWVLLPDWEKHGRGAGFIRNRDIIKACTRVVAFWDGESKGTADSIELSRKLGKPRIIKVFPKAN